MSPRRGWRTKHAVNTQYREVYEQWEAIKKYRLNAKIETIQTTGKTVIVTGSRDNTVRIGQRYVGGTSTMI
jgi:ribose 1,5-bisphosphokinase PhnN